MRQHKSVAKPMYSLIPPCTYESLLEVVNSEQVSATQTMLRCNMLYIYIYVTYLSPMDSGAS